MIKLGLGYNPSFILRDGLKLPKETDTLELGFYELDTLSNSDLKLSDSLKLSLHISSNPACSSLDAQISFIAYLKETVNSSKFKEKFSSLGLHLAGDRNKGIGKYGFSPHYHPTALNFNKALDFYSRVRNELDLKILIENANFYSKSPDEIKATWEQLGNICKAVDNAGIIFDISHLYIDAYNLKLKPEYLVSYIPIDYVEEVHFSGVSLDSLGILHDGHCNPIPEEIWDIYRNLMNHKILDKRKLLAVIEHTDISWHHRKELYKEDINKLCEINRELNESKSFNNFDLDAIARSYLIKLMQKSMPNIGEIYSKYNLKLDESISRWSSSIFDSGQRIRIQKLVDTYEETEAVYAFESFYEHAIREVENVGGR